MESSVSYGPLIAMNSLSVGGERTFRRTRRSMEESWLRSELCKLFTA